MTRSQRIALAMYVGKRYELPNVAEAIARMRAHAAISDSWNQTVADNPEGAA